MRKQLTEYIFLYYILNVHWYCSLIASWWPCWFFVSLVSLVLTFLNVGKQNTQRLFFRFSFWKRYTVVFVRVISKNWCVVGLHLLSFVHSKPIEGGHACEEVILHRYLLQVYFSGHEWLPLLHINLFVWLCFPLFTWKILTHFINFIDSFLAIVLA